MRKTYIAMTASGLMLAGCAATSSGGVGSTGDPLTRAAEAACVARANSVTNSMGASVVRAEFSQANTLVTVSDSRGNRYRCLSSNDGVVAEFSRM